jgi:hypothetical protein
MTDQTDSPSVRPIQTSTAHAVDTYRRPASGAHYVVEDRDHPGWGREVMAPIAGPFDTANQARAERDRLQALDSQRYRGAYVVAWQDEGEALPGHPEPPTLESAKADGAVTLVESWPEGLAELGTFGTAEGIDEASALAVECGYQVAEVRQRFRPGHHFLVLVEVPSGVG